MTTRKRGMRTKKGNVTKKARKKSGMKGKGKKGKFPVFDRKSALSAIKLRHHGKGVSAAAVLRKVAAWASAHNDRRVLRAVARAREVDRKRRGGKK
ncbi:MAG: hypothetical protein GWN58_25595 [Anaerolineae bacterium]|nr:hypothetical protein [Anaerolineae bacterium]